MSNFQVGDVCEIVAVINPQYKHLIGRECTVRSIGRCHDPGCWAELAVDVGGETWCTFYRCLRKKRPPGDVWADHEAMGDWGLCPWRPAKRKEPQPDDAAVDTAMRLGMKEAFGHG